MNQIRPLNIAKGSEAAQIEKLQHEIEAKKIQIRSKISLLGDKATDVVGDVKETVNEKTTQVRDRYEETKADIREKMDMKIQFEKHPLWFVGAAAAGGFLFGDKLIRPSRTLPTSSVSSSPLGVWLQQAVVGALAAGCASYLREQFNQEDMQ